jgi:hypothetical protein
LFEGGCLVDDLDRDLLGGGTFVICPADTR